MLYAAVILAVISADVVFGGRLGGGGGFGGSSSYSAPGFSGSGRPSSSYGAPGFSGYSGGGGGGGYDGGQVRYEARTDILVPITRVHLSTAITTARYLLLPNIEMNATGNFGTSQHFWCVRANTVTRKQWQIPKQLNHCKKGSHSNHTDNCKLENHDNHTNKRNYRNTANLGNEISHVKVAVTVHGSLCKVSVLSDFNQNWNLSTEFSKNIRHEFSRKSIWWESNCSMPTDRQTERQTDK
jgi:hypothetical protein